VTNRLRRIAAWSAAVVVLAAAISIGLHYWRQRQTEAFVTHWVLNAEQYMVTSNYEEARKTLEMLIRRHPESWQMGRVHYAMGRLQLDYLGSLVAAQHYFSDQVTRYPFNRQTVDSLRKLAEINQLSGFGTAAGDKPYRHFIHARRVLLSGRADEGVSLMRENLLTWPESAIAPEVLLTLGNHFLLDRRRPSEARPFFALLQERYPTSEAAKKMPAAALLNAPDPPEEPFQRS
jgi:tetratricopeptide (TPR) repeat protein